MSGAAAVTELLMLATVATITSTLGKSENEVPEVLGHRISVSMGALIAIAAVLVLVRCGFGLYESYLEARLGSRYEQEKRAALVSAFMDASWPAQSAQRGNESQDVVTGAVAYGRIGAKAVAGSLGSVCSTAIMLAGALAMSWVATLLAVILSVTLAVAVQPMVRRSKTIGATVRDLSFEYVTAFGETVAMAREIRLADVAAQFTERLDAISTRIRHQRTQEQVYLNAAPIIFETGAFLIVVAGLAALHYASLGNATRFIAMLLLLLRASQYGRSLQGTYHQLKAALPYLDVIDKQEQALRNAAVEGGGRDIDAFGAIELRNISYAYVPGRNALDRVSMRIEKGDIIGIIGPSGSGKSTLVELLLGLRIPTSGEYLVDGRPQIELSPNSWHRLTGLVTQEPQLIEGDISDNIRFLRESITEADIDDAVRASGLDRDMESLHDGLRTRIGPRSSGISGGQRQRLSIARVLADRPQLLVLDEPTSALDVHSETVVTNTLERLKGSATIIVVAHRLSTLRACDKVAVIRDGVLEAFADRAELERDNVYYRSALDLAQIAQ